jgi:hypothetical protein
MSLCRILDQQQPVLISDRAQALHIGQDARRDAQR